MSKLKITPIKYEQLNLDEKLILENNVRQPPEKIDTIFRSEPMFGSEEEKPANPNILYDLIFVLKPEDDDEFVQQLIKESTNKCQKRFAYVYNCIYPDNSEFGTVGFDKNFKYRIF